MQYFQFRSIRFVSSSINRSYSLVRGSHKVASAKFAPSSQSGSALIEAALILPVLLLLCAGLLSLASFLRDDVVLQRALRSTSLSIARYEPPLAIAGDPNLVCADIRAVALDLLRSEGLAPQRYSLRIDSLALNSYSTRGLQRISIVENTPRYFLGFSAPAHSSQTAIMARSIRLPIDCA